MSRGRDMSAAERALWRHVTRHVRPLRPATPQPDVTPESALPSAAVPRPGPATPPPSPSPRPALQPQALGPVADASGHRKVRRGQVEPARRLDLHGLNQDQARAALLSSVAQARAEGGRSLLVITGKGGRTLASEDFWAPQPGVLRRALPAWLNDPALRPWIAGYAPAHARHGGSGAFYVFLKAP
jgi:DNA-nicking Smr family endonuclease